MKKEKIKDWWYVYSADIIALFITLMYAIFCGGLIILLVLLFKKLMI